MSVISINPITAEPDGAAPPAGAGPTGADPSWEGATQDYRHDYCVPHLVAARASATPDAVAMAAGRQVLSYRELEAQANRLARHLRALGVERGDLVALCLDRSISYVVAALGILKAGAAYVPLDPAYPVERLAYILGDAGAPVVLTASELAARLPGGSWRVVTLDGDAMEIARQPATPPAIAMTADDLAYVVYTSGSTGQPKGARITHDSLLNLVYWHRDAFAVTPDDRATHLAGPAFDAAVWELWPYLTAGASVYLPDEATRVSPVTLRDWLVAWEITMAFLPTALAEEAMALAWPETTRLRLLLVGADTLHHYPSPTLPFAVVNNYGLTECAVVSTSGQVPPAAPDAQPGLSPSIGRPIANTEAYILDAALRPVPTGEPGELYIGGAGLAQGYHNRPDLTAERFIPHPFSDRPGARLYRTGDLARYLPDGQIQFMGRADEQIKIRGYRIEPAEIIAALNTHPAVRTSLVLAREDTPGDKRLVAYVVPLAPAATGAARPADGALGDYLRARLPDYMVPARVVWLEALPLTPNGKVDRDALPAPDTSAGEEGDAFVAPRTGVEGRVATIVAGLLRLERVGVDDNFFMLGGHSLLGAQLIARVRDAFEVDLTLRSLFDAPTVAELAAEVERLIFAKIEAMTDDEAQRLLARGL